MAQQIKISELIPKGAPLATSDLLMISESTPDGFESRSITGAEIVTTAQEGLQPTLVSGTNIKTLEGQSLLGSGNIDLTKSDVGLSNVDNTSDLSKPISTATQTALNAKQDTLVSGTNIKTLNGNSLLGSGNIAIQTNPRLLGFSGILGTQTTSTNITICHSVLIPANTLTTNSILQVIFRMYRQSGNVGQMYGRIYFNTTNSLTGATLLNSTFQMNGAGVQFLGLVERNFSYNGTNLTTYQNSAFSEFTTGSALSIATNRTVDNYILLTMQCQTASDIANIDLVKVFAYV